MGSGARDTPELLERAPELARIDAALEAAREGAGSLLLVEGPSGIGKTALLDRARAMAGAGVTVLAARPTELEREHPFGVVRQLFEAELRAAADERRDALLAGPARHAAPALGLGGPPEPGPPASEFALLNGLHWLLAGLAEDRPVLALVDDAHWADRDSIRFLSFLEPRLRDLAVLLLVAARPEGRDRVAGLGATASDPSAKALAPSPLSESAAAALLATILGCAPDPEFAAACHLATGGNPFYLRALAGELERDRIEPEATNASRVARLTPRSVSRTTIARLPGLAEGAAAVAEAVAVLGEDATLARIAELAGLEADVARAALEALVVSGLVGTAIPPRFTHPIIRNTVIEEMAGSRRADLHRRTAGLLRRQDAAAERVASHLLAVESDGDEGTVAILRDAAGAALARGAPRSAVACLRRGLAEPPPAERRAELLAELGSAETLVDGEAAVEHLSEALELTRDELGRALLAAVLARTLIFADRGAEGIAVAERSIAELGDRHGEARAALEAMVLAVANTDPGLAEPRVRLLERLAGRQLDGAVDPGSRALRVALAGMGAYACAPAGEVVPRIERELADGALLEHDNGGAHLVAAVLVLAMADSELALPTLARGLELARERGDLVAWTTNKVLSAHAHLVRGELRAAAAAAEEGLDASAECRVAIGAPWGGWCLAGAQLAAGDLEQAERTLARVEAPEEIPFNTIWAPYVDARAQLACEAGDLDAALEDSLWCGRLLDSLGATNPALLPWRSRAALCLARLGDRRDQALELAEEELALARSWGAPRALGAALRARGVVRGGAEGVESLREAAAVLEGSPARLERARALIDLGAALRRDGGRSECREPLRAGMDLAWRCGARSLAEHARTELRASGARPRKLVLSGVESLTPSERRVAGMAADGLSNREIAQDLYLTKKTVESHLRVAYRKLEIGSREDLPRALAAGERSRTAAGDPS